MPPNCNCCAVPRDSLSVERGISKITPHKMHPKSKRINPISVRHGSSFRGRYGPSPGRLALQLTILTLSACTVWLPLSILNVTFLIRNVHTSSQSRYVSRLPYNTGSAKGDSLAYSDRAARHQRAWGISRTVHLELQTAADVLLECFRDGLIKVSQDLHGQLRMDARLADKVVERIRQRKANAA